LREREKERKREREGERVTQITQTTRTKTGEVLGVNRNGKEKRGDQTKTKKHISMKMMIQKMERWNSKRMIESSLLPRA